MKPRVAALLTCHNRRAATLEGLGALFASSGRGTDFDLEVWLVDDGSTDGTADAVGAAFPEVHLVPGDGQRFWAGGMRLAFEHAARHLPDFLLFLNDDARLRPDAVQRLLRTHAARRALGEDAIVVGPTRDERGQLSYGGLRRARSALALRYELLPPADVAQPCDTFHGNIVLVPRPVYAALGNLSPEFVHGQADFDYGLRARAAGFGVWTAAGFLGECVWNPLQGTWRDPSLGLRERWRRVMSPKGLPPREWWVYTRRHGGPLWPLQFALPYVKLVLTSLTPRRGA